MAGIFGEFFLVSVSHKMKARKLLKKFGENSEQNLGKKIETKIRKIRGPSFCNFSDLRLFFLARDEHALSGGLAGADPAELGNALHCLPCLDGAQAPSF